MGFFLGGIKHQGASRNRLAPVVIFLGLQGFEPRLAVPETDVLPLHHSPNSDADPHSERAEAERVDDTPSIVGGKKEVKRIPIKFCREGKKE